MQTVSSQPESVNVILKQKRVIRLFTLGFRSALVVYLTDFCSKGQ